MSMKHRVLSDASDEFHVNVTRTVNCITDNQLPRQVQVLPGTETTENSVIPGVPRSKGANHNCFTTGVVFRSNLMD